MNYAKVYVTDPDSVELTFVLSLPAGEWRKVIAALPGDGSIPGRVGKMLREMVLNLADRADKRYDTSGYFFSPEKEPE